MCWTQFKSLFENFGDFLSLFGGPIVSIIVSFIQWIIFIIQLSKTFSLDVNSLTINHNIIVIGVHYGLQDKYKCYAFADNDQATAALKHLQGDLLTFSQVLGIIWIIFQILLISSMTVEFIKKAKGSWLKQSAKQLYIEYYTFLISIFSNTVLLLINQLDFDQDCIVNYPVIGGDIVDTTQAWIASGSAFFFNCLIGNTLCWMNHENPHCCFLYLLSQLVSATCKLDSSLEKVLSDICCCGICCYCIHFVSFLFMLFWVAVPIFESDLIFAIPTIIIFLVEVIDITIKCYKLKKNNFEPYFIKSKKIEPERPESQPSLINTNN